MTTAPPEIPRSPWGFVALVGAGALVTAWAVRRAGGFAQALAAAAAPVLDIAGDDEPADELDEADETEYAAGDDDELPDEAPPPNGDQW